MAQSIGSTTDGLKKDRDHSLTIVIQKIDPAIFRIARLSLREVISGSSRFNDLRRVALPRTSPAPPSKRLKELEAAAVKNGVALEFSSTG